MSNNIESIADAFVLKWCKTKYGEEICEVQEDFKNDLIEMIAELHSQYIIASIRNEVCGKNLHSQYDTIMCQFKNLENQIKDITKENVEIPQVKSQDKKKSKSKSSKSDLGPFVSKVALDFAKENNIDPNIVIGTGKDGKIGKSDISKVIKKNNGIVKKSSDSKKFCNGHTASGDPCKSTGKVNIKGKWFCNRHKSQGQQCENVEEADQFDNYDEETTSEKIDRFRDQSIKSLETVGEKDSKLNDMMDNDTDDEIEGTNDIILEGGLVDEDEISYSEDEYE